MNDEEDYDLPVEGEEKYNHPPTKRDDVKTPAALKPRTDWEGADQEVTSGIYDGPVSEENHDQLLIDSGYDPTKYDLLEPLKISTWDTQTADGKETFWSYKFSVQRKTNVIEGLDQDFKELIKEVKKHRPLSDSLPDGDETFLVLVADTQIGKADGDGLKGTLARIYKAIDGVDQRIRDLRKIGSKLDELVVGCMGDLIEGCDQNYPSQTFTTEINRRRQTRLMRRILRDAIAKWSKQFNKVTVVAVPGNHGENRKNGKAFTTRGDNDDVSIPEQVADILAANPEAYGHVEFILPEDELYVVRDCSGVRVGFSHGHVTSSGTSPQIKQKNWWSSQTFNNQAIGSAEILVTAHFHHFSVVEYSTRKIHFQCPSLDGGSEWFEDLSGEQSRPGMLTVVVGGDKIYHDLEVI